MKENEGGKDKFKSLDLIYIIPYKRDSQQGPRCIKRVQHSCNNLYGEKFKCEQVYVYVKLKIYFVQLQHNVLNNDVTTTRNKS